VKKSYLESHENFLSAELFTKTIQHSLFSLIQSKNLYFLSQTNSLQDPRRIVVE
jgi:hypothetical protein